ncbi:maleylacetoacetate isomerase [Acinetobacter sp. ANC 3903]|uniref:maleylacetoacetate isomerase n=1 Tax=Acinetobacter sp. ANC 3903 TaxID=1977883 RepID=UPI000A336EE7|nr:maleylacetoacetate isomerase [Acinetobacter sp. ANC 3903]OTG58059.1 maleylacetoacetate isomerase [Acinetobacter sp. ANC 3903]
MQLYTYFRSSAAYRVRIALNLKGLNADYIPVHLVNNGGEQHSDAYKAVNPSELVPTWVEDEFQLSQSLSILEYLNEQHPEVALLPPQDTQQRALVRAFSLTIACDIHPLNNLRVLQYLSGTLQVTDEQKTTWYKHWVETGFKTLEALLAQSNGKFCFGEQATIADCCLIPQFYNALRFNVDLSAYPKIEAIYNHCNTLEAFKNAAPEAQQEAA